MTTILTKVSLFNGLMVGCIGGLISKHQPRLAYVLKLYVIGVLPTKTAY